MSTSPESLPPQEGPSYPTSQQTRILWTALTALAVTVLIGVAALVFMGFISFLTWSYPILLPLGLAVIIALFLEPGVDFLQKRGLKRGRATLIVCISAVIAFMLFWAYLLPTIWDQSSSFFRDLPDNVNKAAVRLQSSLGDASVPVVVVPSDVTLLHTNQPPTHVAETLLLSAVPDGTLTASPAATPVLFDTNLPASHAPAARHGSHGLIPDSSPARPIAIPSPLHAWITGNLPALQDMIQKNIFSLFTSALGPVGQAFGFILGFGFVPIYVYYFLSEQEDITKHWHYYVPLRHSKLRDEVVTVIAEINASLVGYFRGQIIVAACNGVLTWLGLWAIGVPYSLVLGLITGALSIVPFLGIIASILPALLLGYLSAKGDPTWQWVKPLMVLGVFGIVQMSESIFITPRVQSHSTGLHPLTIILGILFWSLLLPGLLGPIVAVPLTCAIVVLLRRYAWPEKPAAVIADASAAPPSPLKDSTAPSA